MQVIGAERWVEGFWKSGVAASPPILRQPTRLEWRCGTPSDRGRALHEHTSTHEPSIVDHFGRTRLACSFLKAAEGFQTPGARKGHQPRQRQLQSKRTERGEVGSSESAQPRLAIDVIAKIPVYGKVTGGAASLLKLARHCHVISIHSSGCV